MYDLAFRLLSDFLKRDEFIVCGKDKPNKYLQRADRVLSFELKYAKNIYIYIDFTKIKSFLSPTVYPLVGFYGLLKL